MAQSGFTPILIYGSGTASAVPSSSNLTSTSSGVELALNYADGKLYFKNSSGVVTLLASSATAGGGVTTFSSGTTGLTPNTATSGAITLSGTLNVANGGTGITSFGTGVAAWLGTPNSANLRTAITDETGSGSLVFATSPTLVTPVLGTPASVTLTNATGLPVAGISATGTPSSTTYLRGDGTWSTVSGGASGTVTSVSFTGGIVSVATPTSTPALTVAGTSGGIPYFSSGTTWASSAALTASALMIGGGAGVAPSTTTTGTGVLTALGNSVNAASGIVVKDANSNVSANSFTPGWTSTATAATTTTLTNASTYYQRFTGATTQTVQLPAANTVALGQGFIIDNDSTGALALQDGTPSSLGSVAPGMAAFIFCENNGSVAGSWSGYLFVPGGGPSGQVTWGTATLSMGGQNITNSVWNGTAITPAYGGTGSTATPTNGGVVYGTGTAMAVTAAGTTGQVLTSNGAAAPTWQAGGNNPAGTIILYAGTTAPTGYLICPTSLTNVSRTTYAALFAAIGTTWGAGDGSTTFGLPWFAAGYVPTQANANVGTATTGQVISHTHTFSGPPSNNGSATGGISTGNLSNETKTTSNASGAGASNLAAGAAVLMCVKY